ncbi:retinoid-inducible serine carboxypeptidase [Aethina tumida]|uniref:retinoid-inducible serine carboxypeptidase n=1 Tax=Aethina tumida TaxID=116153 RepID=UPI002147E9E4|nr:retinoid-inducible serine carboxypeptidase [Aethina tumida]XP_049821434.1 retinoid-inducible serine carboxypeptidase [Aethina tumida]
MIIKTKFIFILILGLTYARTGFGPGEQEWGFVEVRDNAHIFYWLYLTTAAVNNVTEKPLVIWLQGGPGASSTGYGNFAELGPLDVDLKERNFTWVKNYNVLFVDNPVGTGFSYVENDAYATTNRQIAIDFVEFLKGFYKQNPIFVDTPLYIFCESYGGKMTAEIALILDQAIKAQEINIKFKGVGLGDSWISPIDSVLSWAPYLLQLGIVDQNGYDKIVEAALTTQNSLNEGKYSEATMYWTITEMRVSEVTSGVDFYNVLKKIENSSKRNKLFLPTAILRDEDDAKVNKIMNGDVRKALNISRAWGTQSSWVFSALREDFMKPVTDVVEKLLNETTINVAIYNGQLDLIVDTPGTVKWVDELRWNGSENWKTVTRQPFVVNGIIEGFVKEADNLTFWWVNRAGHMVPSDNPAAMEYILEHLIQRTS